MKRAVSYILFIVIFTSIILYMAKNGNENVSDWLPVIVLIIVLLPSVIKTIFKKLKMKKSPYSIKKSEELLSVLKNTPAASRHGEALEKLGSALAQNAKVLALFGEDKTIYDRVYALSQKISQDYDSAAIEAEVESIIEFITATNNINIFNYGFDSVVHINRVKSNFAYGLGCIAVLFILTLIAMLWLRSSNIEPDRIFLSIALLFLATVISIIFFIYGKKIKDRVKRLQKCFPYFIESHETSIANVAEKTSIPSEIIQKDLLYIIKKKYFTRAYINYDTNEFFIGM